MSDLIRLEDVLAIIDKRTVKGKLQVAREVLKLPTIEPEPQIVRCKDCMYSDTDNTLGVLFCWRVSYHEASEDGFCHWAERRTDEN